MTDTNQYGGNIQPMPSDAQRHETFCDPEWEYATSSGPRKQEWDDSQPPAGDGWVRNVEAGSEGWDRFDYHEESYWRRRRAVPDE